MNYDDMFLFVKKCLENGDAISSKTFPFRNRYTHIVRVYKWCLRLLPDFPLCNKDVLLTSAIFHDVGYVNGQKNHADTSATIFKKYAVENGFADDFIDLVYYNIKNHSNKSLLNDSNTNKELILLLEADLLDEEGILGIVWDLLAEGRRNPSSYNDAIKSLLNHSGHILNQDYMVTPIAKKYWNEKKNDVKNFINGLKNDLFMEDNYEL